MKTDVQYKNKSNKIHFTNSYHRSFSLLHNTHFVERVNYGANTKGDQTELGDSRRKSSKKKNDGICWEESLVGGSPVLKFRLLFDCYIDYKYVIYIPSVSLTCSSAKTSTTQE
jgi:hypothetical protein